MHLGRVLSAFNLKINIRDDYFVSLESAFQGSKKFENGGPFVDLYGLDGSKIKADERLKESGKLIGFEFNGKFWNNRPKTAFYDYLYITSTSKMANVATLLEPFSGFSDIEFNQNKSINCQARSCALYVSLTKRGILDRILKDKEMFLDYLSRDSSYQPHSQEITQGSLFYICLLYTSDAADE